MNSIKSEDQFRRHVIDVALGQNFHVTHVESPVTSAGVPDLNLARTLDCWVELKVVKHECVKMRPTQKRWHRERFEHDGKSWVMTFDPDSETVLVTPGRVAWNLGPGISEWRAVSNTFRLSDLELALEYVYEER